MVEDLVGQYKIPDVAGGDLSEMSQRRYFNKKQNTGHSVQKSN